MDERGPASAEWRSEMQRRRREYEEKRRRWVAAWRDERPEPPTDEADGKGRRGRTVHDRRQFRFDF